MDARLLIWIGISVYVAFGQVSPLTGTPCVNKDDCYDGFDCTIDICVDSRCLYKVNQPVESGCCLSVANCDIPVAPCNNVVCSGALGNQCVYTGSSGCDPQYTPYKPFPIPPTPPPPVEPAPPIGPAPSVVEPVYQPFPEFSTVVLPEVPPSLQLPETSNVAPFSPFSIIPLSTNLYQGPFPDFSTIVLPEVPPSLQLPEVSTVGPVSPFSTITFQNYDAPLPPLSPLDLPTGPISTNFNQGPFSLPPLDLPPGPAFLSDSSNAYTISVSLGTLLITLALVFLVLVNLKL